MKRLILGEEGLKFLQSFLEAGYGLGKQASAVIYERGQILTWLPDEFDLTDGSFQGGWFSKHETPSENLWQPLRNIMLQFLRANANHVAITETSLMKPDEDIKAWINSTVSPEGFFYFTCEETSSHEIEPETIVGSNYLVSIFGFLSGTEVTVEQVTKLIEDAFPFHEIYVLTSWPDGEAIPSSTKVGKDYLRKLADQAEYVAIGAYDGSGVILWKDAPVLSLAESVELNNQVSI